MQTITETARLEQAALAVETPAARSSAPRRPGGVGRPWLRPHLRTLIGAAQFLRQSREEGRMTV